MAEKRQSTSGKVATPKVPAQPQDLNEDRHATIGKAIGARVKVTTSLPNHTLEGTLFTACPITNVIALNTAPAPPNPSSNAAALPGDYHIIPVSHISSFAVVSLPTESDRAAGSAPGFQGALPSISKLDLEDLKAREVAAVKKLKEKEAMRNKNATKEGQEVFDHVSRTLPTYWANNDIVANENVVIKPPYRTEDCSASKANQNALQHVQRVLEGYYAKKKSTTARPGVATPIPPRKGG